jgi:hypothetical protein
MSRPTYDQPGCRHPLLRRLGWLGAIKWGTLLTPLAVLVSLLAPAWLSLILRWPVFLGQWIDTPRTDGREAGAMDFEGPATGPLGLVLGEVLAWLWYVVLARVILWRIAAGRAEREGSIGRLQRCGPA